MFRYGTCRALSHSPLWGVTSSAVVSEGLTGGGDKVDPQIHLWTPSVKRVTHFMKGSNHLPNPRQMQSWEGRERG